MSRPGASSKRRAPYLDTWYRWTAARSTATTHGALAARVAATSDRAIGCRGTASWWSLFRTEAAAYDVARGVGRLWRSRRRGSCPATAIPLNTCYVVRCPTHAMRSRLVTILNSPLASAWLGQHRRASRGGYRRLPRLDPGAAPASRALGAYATRSSAWRARRQRCASRLGAAGAATTRLRAPRVSRAPCPTGISDEPVAMRRRRRFVSRSRGPASWRRLDGSTGTDPAREHQREAAARLRRFHPSVGGALLADESTR